METTCVQYNKLLSEIFQWLNGHRITQLRVLALWMYGLFQAKHCSLHKFVSSSLLGETRVADYLPLESNKASKIQRLERFLKNPGIVVKIIYMEIVKVMLEKWNSRSLDIAMDRTDWKIFNLLLCGIAYNNRVLPFTFRRATEEQMGWRLLKHAGNSDFDEQKELLDSIRPTLPKKCHISLLGDGEFKSVELMRYALTNGWDFNLGQSKSTWMKYPSGRWEQLQALKVSEGSPCYYQCVRPKSMILVW